MRSLLRIGGILAASVALHLAALWALSHSSKQDTSPPRVSEQVPVEMFVSEALSRPAVAPAPTAPAPAQVRVPPRPAARESGSVEEAPEKGGGNEFEPATPGETGELAATSPALAPRAAGSGPEAGSGGGPEGGTGPRTSGDSGASEQLISALHARLAQAARRCYPSAARRFRLVGEVRLSFCLDGRGGVQRIEAQGTSGSPILDRAAVDCVVPGAVPLPGPATCVNVAVQFRGD